METGYGIRTSETIPKMAVNLETPGFAEVDKHQQIAVVRPVGRAFSHTVVESVDLVRLVVISTLPA